MRDVDLTWLDPTNLDPRDVAGAVAVLEAARKADAPYDLGHTASSFAARIRHGWDGTPPVVAILRDDKSRVIGVLEIELPIWDNRHLGILHATVDPLRRRQGLGRRLFEIGVDRVRSEGRTVLLTYGLDSPGNVAFAEAMGVVQASVEVQRRLDVLAVDWDQLDNEYAKAEAHATAYDLVRFAARIPDEDLPAVADLTAAINDAPTDDLDIEDEVFTPERIRRFEAAQDGAGRRTYRLVARERSTGVLGGHTMVAVESERPWFGWQYDTSVLPAHRGHRLGLLLKIGMLHWLREQEPQLRTIDTWNAATNAHMIGVNEVVGFRVMANEVVWQRRL